MSAPRNALQAVLDRQAASSPTPPQAAAVRVADEAPARAGKFNRPSREGLRLIAGHFDPKVAKQLKLLAAEEDTSIQALLEEAVDLLFLKKGKGRMVSV